MALYEEQGPITCFVGVGGNLTTTGPGEKDVGWGVIQPSKRMTEDKQRADPAVQRPGPAGAASAEREAAGGGLRPAL